MYRSSSYLQVLMGVAINSPMKGRLRAQCASLAETWEDNFSSMSQKGNSLACKACTACCKHSQL